MASTDGLFDGATLERIIRSRASADDAAPLRAFLNASEVDNCEPLDESERAMAQTGAKIDHYGRITQEARYEILDSVGKVMNKQGVHECVYKRLVDHISVNFEALRNHRLSVSAAKAWISTSLPLLHYQPPNRQNRQDASQPWCRYHKYSNLSRGEAILSTGKSYGHPTQNCKLLEIIITNGNGIPLLHSPTYALHFP